MIPDPSSVINPVLVAKIREQAPRSEAMGRLTQELLELVYQQNWFRLFVPEKYNGLALDLPSALELEEAIAWADGSLGWTVTLCSGANWFVGFLPETIAEPIFSDPHVCLAGTGKASGTARRTGDFYEVQGEWKYATGSPHATAFTANCVLDGEAQGDRPAENPPPIASFIFLPSEVKKLDTWKTIGMVATASHGFSVHGLKVPVERCFLISAANTQLPDPIFQYPFQQFAETTLAVNISGMAFRFLELAGNYLGSAAEALASLHLRQYEFQGLRKEFFQSVRNSWDYLLRQGNLPDPVLQQVSGSAARLFQGAMEAVDRIYPACGLAAADPSVEINRVWRNIHTASQHRLFHP